MRKKICKYIINKRLIEFGAVSVMAINYVCTQETLKVLQITTRYFIRQEH